MVVVLPIEAKIQGEYESMLCIRAIFLAVQLLATPISPITTRTCSLLSSVCTNLYLLSPRIVCTRTHTHQMGGSHTRLLSLDAYRLMYDTFLVSGGQSDRQ